MKTNAAALLLSTFLAALCASLVDANGVCYDPDHALSAKSEASIIKDMQSIRQKGFTHVRTYISKFGNVEMAKIIRDQGLTLALGVPYGNPDYAEQLKSAISVASGGNVQYLFIGNENLRGSVPGSFISEIRRVKGLVPSSVKVGTVQRNTEILENISGLGELIAACDAIGINIHPFFTPGQNGATNAIELTKSMWNKALGIAGNKLVLTETGWPTQGSFAGNGGSTAAASGYFQAYNAWTAIPGDKRFYFQMFDQPTRAEDFEKAYGIFTKDNVDKFGVAVNPVPPTAPAQQSPAPTSAPTPTPTPTTKPTLAPSNSTSQTSGSTASSTSHDLSPKVKGEDTGAEDSHSASDTSESTQTSEDATAAATTDAPAVVSDGHGDAVAGESDGTTYAGGANKSTETNSKSAGSTAATTVVFAVAAGCMAVVAAFGFIYHARKKAAELEAAEAKDSFAITPHNGCVL